MRKTQQQNSRKLSTRRFRRQQWHRKLKRHWLSVVVMPLKQQGMNTRAQRMMRRATVPMGILGR